MKTVDFTQHLLNVQSELFRFAFKLTADREEANDLLQETSLKALDNEEKFTPDTNFKGWMYTIMRNIFINNYRKTVRDQTFVDQTDNLFHLNFSQESGFDSTEGAYDCCLCPDSADSRKEAGILRQTGGFSVTEIYFNVFVYHGYSYSQTDQD